VAQDGVVAVTGLTVKTRKEQAAMTGSEKTDSKRLDRIEQAIAEHTQGIAVNKGDWRGPTCERSAAGRIYLERQAAELVAAEHEAARRAEIERRVAAEVAAEGAVH
jgi:hypothetical protein